MKKVNYFLILSLTILFHTAYSQCSQYPVSLSSRVNSSSIVVEGKVIARQCFWNSAGNYLYTSNLIEVNKVMKGSLLVDRLEIITDGGEIGLQKQTVEPSLQLRIEDEGVFTLSSFVNTNSQYGYATFRAVADAQGFIKFDPTTNSALEPFKKYNNIATDLYPELETLLGIELSDLASPPTGKGYSSSSVAAVSGISPLTLTAGTSSIVTISGSGFGTTQGTSFVEFYNADDGGATFVKADPSQYVSWSSTQIQVMVPTRAGTVAGTAGTGPVRVTVASSPTLSAQTLTVSYGELNVYYGPTSTVYNTRHVDLNGSAGISWQMYTSFNANTAARTAFLSSLQTWRCNTYINWGLGPTTTTNTIALDGINIVRFDISTELPVGVLGRCTSYFSGCITGTVINWFVDELDICFDDPATSVITWQFGPTLASGIQYDFESVSLHELGHGHQLSHVINSNDVMHYALSNAQNKRSLIAQNINGGNDVMSRNTSAGVCSMASMAALNSSICSVSVPTASFNISSPVCVGQSVTLNAISINNPTSWSWTITGGSISSSTLQNISVTYTAPGIYSISLQASNGFGSSATLTKTISIVAQPTLSIASATICSGTSTVLTVSGASTYTWNPGALSGATQTLNPSSTLVYTLSGSNGACSSLITSTITVNTTPTINVSNATICSGSSTLITANGATSYTWSPGALSGVSQNLNPLSTTPYTVSGQTGLCNALPVIFTITVNTTPTLVAPNASICSGASTLLIASGASSYTWNPGNLSGSSQNLNPIATTIYTLTGSIGTCTSNISITVSVSPSPTLSVPNAAICSGSSSLITASGATSYTWNPGNLSGASQNLNPASTSVYTITGSVGICTQSTTATVSVTTSPSISVSGGTLCAGNSLVKTASGATNYTWNPGALTGATQTLSPTSTTIYTITGANGICIDTKTAAITVFFNSIFAFSSPATICNGGTVTLLAGGAATYTWTNSIPGFSLTGAAPIASPSVSTLYTVAGSNGTCVATTTVFLQVDPNPTINITPSPSVCSGSSTVLTASGADSYTWNPGNLTGATRTLSPLATTIYTITGTYSVSGCSSVSSSTLTVLPKPLIFAITSPTSICLGNTSTLSAGGAVSYSWTPGALTGATVVVSPTAQTIYTVTGFDGFCINSNTLLLAMNPVPTLTTVNAFSICTGGQSVTASVSGAITYTWNPGNIISQNPTLSPSITTIYTVTGENSFGCKSSNNVTVNVAQQPTLNIVASSATVCPGKSATLTATGANNYTWIPGLSTSSAIVLNPTTTTNYSLSGNTGYCTASVSATLYTFNNPTIGVTASPAFTVCSGSTISLTASGGTSYTWMPSNSNGNIVVVSPLSNSSYTVTGTSVNGCTASAIPVVTIVPNPTITTSASQSVICIGNTTTLTASGAVNYTWLPGSSTGSSTVVAPVAPTLYQVIGMTALCSSTGSIVILTNPTPTVIASASSGSICSGKTASLSAGGAITYSWSPGNLLGSTVSVNPNSTTIYTVTGSYSTGCSSASTLALLVAPSPTLNPIATATIVCAGKSVTLSASGATAYTWSPASATNASVAVTPTAPTSYQVTGILGTCTSTSSIIILVNPTPTISTNSQPTSGSICKGNNITLQAVGANSYTWIPGGLIGQIIVVSPSITTVYTVSGTYGNSGCSSERSTTVTVVPNPTITPTSGQSTLCAGESTTLSASGASNYTWNPGNLTGASVSVTPSLNTTYTVIGNNLNCISNTLITVAVNPNPTIVVSSSHSLICRGEEVTLTSSGANSYTYIPGNNINNPIIVTPSINTTYTVNGESSGCFGTVTLMVNVSLCDNINVWEKNGNFTLRPNPAQDDVTIDFTELFDGEISLFNGLGQLIAQEKVNSVYSWDLDLREYAQGVYFVQLNSGNTKAIMLKLVKH